MTCNVFSLQICVRRAAVCAAAVQVAEEAEVIIIESAVDLSNKKDPWESPSSFLLCLRKTVQFATYFFFFESVSQKHIQFLLLWALSLTSRSGPAMRQLVKQTIEI